MPDREKVIEGLKFCTQYGSMCGSDCNGHYERYTDDGYVIKLVDEYRSKCPYGKCETGCVKTLAKDALELLKDHENQLTMKYEEGFNDGYKQAMRESDPCYECQEFYCDDCKFKDNRTVKFDG